MTTGPEDPYGPPSPPVPPYQQSYPQPYPEPFQQPGGYPPQPYGAGYPPGYALTPPNEGLAVASMVVGIVALVLACGYGITLLGSPVALVMGRVSMKRIDRSQGQVGGRGMAQAGFILGIVGTVLLVLGIALAVVVVIIGLHGGFDGTTTFDHG